MGGGRKFEEAWLALVLAVALLALCAVLAARALPGLGASSPDGADPAAVPAPQQAEPAARSSACDRGRPC